MPLIISVRFLTGYCVAAQSKTDSQPEWPLHPARLFMALAAAYFEGEQTGAEREALQWLESLDAPSLSVPEGCSNRAIPTYVPKNDDESMASRGAIPIQSLPSLKRHRAERMFPRTHLPEEDDTLHFVWSNADEVDLARHGSALESLCAQVGRLGHSTSLVQVRVGSGLGPARVLNLVPTEKRSRQRLRTVARTSGTLDRLTQMFERPPHRPTISTTHGYTARDQRERDAAGSLFDPNIEIFRLAPKDSSFRYLDLTTTLYLTRQLHESMLKNVGALGPIPETISGHKPDRSPTHQPHIAYIPIPFVGGEFGDGHLMGVGVVVPANFEADRHADDALTAGLAGLVQNGLVLGQLGTWAVQEDLAIRTTGQMLRAETWTAFASGAKRWASVTPVVFDQHPKSSTKAQYLAEAARLIADMCQRIGLPRPAVRVTPVSRFSGVPTAHDFPRLRRKDGSERRHTHVTIEFEREVIGPVLIGAGRFRGYGLLKPDLAGGRS